MSLSDCLHQGWFSSLLQRIDCGPTGARIVAQVYFFFDSWRHGCFWLPDPSFQGKNNARDK